MAETIHHVIIGDSAAGITAARYIRKTDSNAQIEIYADDPNASYYRAALTNYLIGELRDDQIWAVPPSYFSELNITRTLTRVVQLDTKNARLHLANGDQVSYDRLLIGSGARARPPEFPGADLEGVMVMRTLRDVRQVMDRIKLGNLKQAVVVGGGPLALEWAQGLCERGVSVSILLRGDHFMKNVLDRVGSDLLLAHLKMAGVDVILNDEVEEALPGNGAELGSVKLKSGKTVNCQLLGVAIGVLPNVEFLKNSDVEVGRAGVVVDSQMQTSVKGVYAAGDVAGFDGRAPQLWEPAQQQGRVAGYNMAGRAAYYEPGAHYMATRLFALDFASVGDVSGTDGSEILTDFPTGSGRIALRQVFIRDGKVVGALMLGDRSENVRRLGRTFKRLIDQAIDVSEVQASLLDSHFNLENWLANNTQMEKPTPATIVVSRPAMMRDARLNAGIPKPVAVAAEERPMPQAQLVELNGAKIYPLSALVTLGRAKENTLPLKDAKSSRRHAELRWQGRHFVVLDLGSQNGTYVNETRIAAATPLNVGDVLRIGGTRFELRGSDIVPPPQPLHTMGLSSPLVMPSEGKSLASSAIELMSPASGQRWTLEGQLSKIGRDAENEIVIDDARVSYVHAQIVREVEGYYLRDLGSRNGTWVNGSQIVMAHLLANGDRLRIGGVEMLVVSGSAVAEKPPAPTALIASNPLPIQEKPGLVVASGNHRGIRYEFEKPKLSIGRNPECDIWLDELSVSWRHAEVRKEDDGWAIVDLASKNGTFWHGERLLEGQAMPLEHGGDLRLGRIDLEIDLGADAFPANEAPDEPTALNLPAPELDKTEILAPVRMGTAALLYQLEDGTEQRYLLGDKTLVGRKTGNDLVLADKSVSSRHLEIVRQEAGYFVRDLKSSNHTFLNGRQIGDNLESLQSGDELGVGSRVKLRFIEEE